MTAREARERVVPMYTTSSGAMIAVPQWEEVVIARTDDGRKVTMWARRREVELHLEPDCPELDALFDYILDQPPPTAIPPGGTKVKK